MRIFLIAVTALLTTYTTNAQTDSINYKEALRVIDIWLDAQRDFDRLPGISVAIVNNQNMIYNKGFGVTDMEKKTSASSETLYSICSISKLFTSVAIMKLWEEGKLRLDDEVRTLLPSYNLKQQFNESVPITIRSLLTHSSGLPRESDYPYWSDEFKFPTQKEMLDKLDKQETLYPSSTTYQYSNLGITLLGEIVSAVSGMPYEKYVEENILKPLRLSNTRTFMPKELWRNKLATGYSALYRDGTRKMAPYFNAAGISAAAGYTSSVEDLARFAAWQFRLLNNGGKEIIKASTLKEMQRVNFMDPDWKTTRGLGFAVLQMNGSTYVGHGGSCPGYVSQLLLKPKDKLAVTVMINGQASDTRKYVEGIFNMLAKAKPTPKKTDSLNLEQYAGYYDVYDWLGEVVIVPWQGKLAQFGLPTSNPAESMILFKHVGKDLFRRIRSDDTLGEELRFERDASGNIISYWQHSNPRRKMNKKII